MQQEVWFNKYRIVRLLGRGGTARVYLAEHIKLKTFRAIKFISKQNPQYNLLINEANILKNLKHSCIPIIYDIEEDEYGSYIVEQYLEGETLKEFLNSKGSLREDQIIRFALVLCDLFHYLHSTDKPILYLDLKPDNIIIADLSLKLIDFGSAIFSDEPHKEQLYQGTKGYAAPELYRRNKLDERCDVYSIGMLLYFMTTGSALQDDRKITNIDNISNCSGKLKDIINRCLKFHPSQRYATVAHLRKQLSAIQKKKQFRTKPGQSIRIAVAGAQPRIGVTHLSFRLCRYFIQQKYRCLYQELNDNGDIRFIKGCYENLYDRDGIYEVENIPMLPRENSSKCDFGRYQILVQDYGLLTDGNRLDYLEADIRILILGAKDWELNYAEQAITKVAEYKDVFYLFNFLDGKHYWQATKSMKQTNCYRIPYEPDPYSKVKDSSELELFRELTMTIRMESSC